MTLDNKLIVTPLNHSDFKPYGDIIEISERCESKTINDGYATRYHDLADLDVSSAGGRPLINIFRARPRPLPLTIHMMEQHPLGSQAFIPLQHSPFVIVVAPPGEIVRPSDLVAFISSGFQGVNYARSVWHFPLLVLGEIEQDFVVIDRGGEGDNCIERYFTKEERCILELQGNET
jgi:ureidoglycolate lyase